MSISKLFYALWIIWKARNGAVFEDKHPNPIEVLIRVNTLSSEFLNIYSLGSSNSIQPKLPSRATKNIWRPPRQPYVKINSDVAFDKATGAGWVGLICRDERGRMLTALAHRIYTNSPLVAEAIGLREAASLASTLHLDGVILKSDN